MMKATAALLVLFLLNSPVQSQQTHSAYSETFRKEAISAIDAVDGAYKSVLNRDPDAVYAPLWQNVQASLASLKTEASARREKEFLKLLYRASDVIGMMRSCGSCRNNNTDEFLLEGCIVEQCSTEAKLKVEHDAIAGKLPKDFKSNQCEKQWDALARSVE